MFLNWFRQFFYCSRQFKWLHGPSSKFLLTNQTISLSPSHFAFVLFIYLFLAFFSLLNSRCTFRHFFHLPMRGRSKVLSKAEKLLKREEKLLKNFQDCFKRFFLVEKYLQVSARGCLATQSTWTEFFHFGMHQKWMRSRVWLLQDWVWVGNIGSHMQRMQRWTSKSNRFGGKSANYQIDWCLKEVYLLEKHGKFHFAILKFFK